MQTELKKEPRTFDVNGVKIKDLGKIELEPNEMISFKTKAGKELDITAKEWGFYGTPSINNRLKNQGFKTALVMNEYNKIFIMIVEKDKLEEFKKYLQDDNQQIICWLDNFFERDEK